MHQMGSASARTMTGPAVSILRNLEIQGLAAQRARHTTTPATARRIP